MSSAPATANVTPTPASPEKASTAPSLADVTPAPASPEKIASVMKRVDSQIDYHEKKSAKSQRRYKRIKGTEIIAAALIPFLATLHVNDNQPKLRIMLAIGTALTGVLVTILEGILQLTQYQHLWLTSRSTCEAMNHEKYLYLANGGDYAKAPDAITLLAERIEAIGSQENIRWTALQQPSKPQSGEKK